MVIRLSGLAPGSVHSYRVSASDGVNTVTTAPRTVTVASAGSPYAERVVADGASMYLR